MAEIKKIDEKVKTPAKRGRKPSKAKKNTEIAPVETAKDSLKDKETKEQKDEKPKKRLPRKAKKAKNEEK